MSSSEPGIERKDEFLEALFRQPLDALLPRLENTSAPAARCTLAWIRAFRGGADGVIVPIRRAAHSPREWYGIPWSDDWVRDMRDELLAFVGPSHAQFRGEPDPLAEDRPGEVIRRYTNLPVFRLQWHPGDREAGLIEAIERMLHVRSQSEIRPMPGLRSTGRVLRDFSLAITAGNRVEAEAALGYLRDQDRLDAVNLAFLEVQLRAGLGLWREVEDLPGLSDLKQVRRPLAVTRALIQALYRTRLAPYESDLDRLLSEFRDSVYEGRGTLFDAWEGMEDPDVVKAFMLYAIVATPPKVDLVERLLGVGTLPDGDREIVRRLAERTGPRVEPPPTDLIGTAREFLDEYEFERAYEFAIEAPPSWDRARVLLACAGELESNRIAHAVAEAVDTLEPDQRARLLSPRTNQAIWRRIRAMPGSWSEWLDRLEDLPWREERAVEIAENGADEWRIDDLLNTNELPRIADGVERRYESDVLQRALPAFLRFLQRDERYPRPELGRLYRGLRMALAYGHDGLSASTAVLFVELCAAGLALQPDRDDYAEIVAEAEGICEYGGAATVDALLDLLDYLLSFGCPLPEDRQRLAGRVLGLVARLTAADRVDPEQLRAAIRLARELGVDDLLPALGAESTSAETIEDPLANLDGRVAIYTLTEAAAQRAEDILETRAPRVSVELYHGLVASDRLRQLARSADIFLMVTGSATHAATRCIVEARPSNLPLLRPAGKGTTSIIKELAGYLASRDQPCSRMASRA